MPLYPHSILKKKKPSEVIGAPSVVKPRVNNNNNEPVAIKSKIESDSVDNPSLPGRPFLSNSKLILNLQGKCYVPFLKGSFAEREHRKWIENAIELRNNPYSKESIEKRLSNPSLINNYNIFNRYFH